MTRIIFNLSDAEQEALYRQAKQEYRAPRDQARLLLMRALGFVDGTARSVHSNALETKAPSFATELAGCVAEKA